MGQKNTAKANAPMTRKSPRVLSAPKSNEETINMSKKTTINIIYHTN